MVIDGLTPNPKRNNPAPTIYKFYWYYTLIIKYFFTANMIPPKLADAQPNAKPIFLP